MFRVFILLPFMMAADAGSPTAVNFPDSKYHRIAHSIYYAQVGAEEFRLKDVDLDTFVAFKESPFDYQYLSPLAADRGGFFQYANRIPFPDAHEATPLAAYSHGDCSYLFAHRGRLYRINHNQKQVEPLATEAKGGAWRPFATRNRYIPPRYFTNGNRVYYFDLAKNSLKALPNANPKTFRSGVAAFSFELYWGTDGKSVHAFHHPIAGAHAASFEYVGWVYAKDANRVYVLSLAGAWPIPGADTKTFTIVKGQGIDATDKNHQYSLGKVVR